MPAKPCTSQSKCLNNKTIISLKIFKIPVCIVYGDKYHGNNCPGVNNNDINKNDNSCNTLQKIKVNNPLIIFVGNLNINTIRNKFDAHYNIFKQKIDIILISEVKMDDILPVES